MKSWNWRIYPASSGHSRASHQRSPLCSGRKLAGLGYVLTYGASCVTKHFRNYWILMLGRFFGGIATSLLFSTFESWLVAEHTKVPPTAHKL